MCSFGLLQDVAEHLSEGVLCRGHDNDPAVPPTLLLEVLRLGLPECFDLLVRKAETLEAADRLTPGLLSAAIGSGSEDLLRTVIHQQHCDVCLTVGVGGRVSGVGTAPDTLLVAGWAECSTDRSQPPRTVPPYLCSWCMCPLSGSSYLCCPSGCCVACSLLPHVSCSIPIAGSSSLPIREGQREFVTVAVLQCVCVCVCVCS